MILATLVLGAVTITLPARADARGTEIELGEVAQIESDDAALVDQFESFDLGYAPAPGFSRLFDAGRIARRLATTFPDVQVRFVGEAQVRVHPSTQTILAADIVALARQEIAKMTLGKDAEFTQSGKQSDVVVPAGDSAAHLRLRRGPIQLLDGRNTVPIEILVDGQAYQTVWTAWDVRMWESVLVLTRNVAAGEEVSFDSVKYERVSAKQAGSKLGLQRTALIATRASRALKQGAVLKRSDLVRLELVISGESAVLEVKKGAIQARVSVIASQGGHLGDQIRVVTTDTKRELTATIVGRGQVRIDMTNRRGSF